MNIGKITSETSLHELPFGTAPFLRSPERRRKEAGGGVGGAAPDRRPPWAEVLDFSEVKKKPAPQKNGKKCTHKAHFRNPRTILHTLGRPCATLKKIRYRSDAPGCTEMVRDGPRWSEMHRELTRGDALRSILGFGSNPGLISYLNPGSGLLPNPNRVYSTTEMQ